MNTPERREIVRQVFESKLSHAEVDSYLQHALDQTYWERLHPQSSIGTVRSTTGLEAAPLGESQTATELAKLRSEGYFQTSPVLAPDVLRRMRQAIDRVRTEHWPAVFAYVYDDFWNLGRTPSMVRLVSGFLGDGYSQISRVWAFYVAPLRGARGWQPHNDTGEASRLTVWVPLTDATIDNGCVYVIPRDRLTGDRDCLELESVTQAQLKTLLQSTKALPSPAGAFLGWDHDLIHWGSVSSGGVEPRISLALEFIGPGAVPSSHELPLLTLTTLPPFIERLRAIAKCLHTYASYEPAIMKFGDLGRRLAERLP